MTTQITDSSYSDQCVRVAGDYVERSTRFEVSNIRVNSSSVDQRAFEIKLTHSLIVEQEVSNLVGVHRAGSNDFESGDWQWYQEQVDEQVNADLHREATMDNLVETVRGMQYAAISTKTHLWTNPRRFFHAYACNSCHGAGNVDCGRCGGRGRVSCSGCGGGGRVRETRQVRDYSGHYRTETQYRTCSGCGGMGTNRCSTCRGSGKVTCNPCSGTGYFTRVTATHTYTSPTFEGIYPHQTPVYVHKALCKAGFASLQECSDVAFARIDLFREHATVEFFYTCDMMFAEMSINVDEHQSDWVLFGTPPRIYDAGGILENLLSDDLEDISVFQKSLRRYRPWFHKTAAPAICTFMKSEVNQEIVDANTAGHDTNVILDKVHRSVSEAYIQKTLSSLNAVLHATTLASRIKWTVFQTLLAIPFVFAMLVWMERSAQKTLLHGQDKVYLQSPGNGFSWDAAFWSLPLALICWLIAKWASKRWIKRAAGERLVKWGHSRGFFIGKWTAAMMAILGIAVSGMFYNALPVWIDKEGKAYGTLAAFPAPLQAGPVMPVSTAVPASGKKSQKGSKYKHKQNYFQ